METPKQTLYVQNLNEKIHPDQMSLLLYTIFTRYGRVVDVVCKRNMKLRGQAWIVFENVADAVQAKEKLTGKLLCGKELKIYFAKSQSDTSMINMHIIINAFFSCEDEESAGVQREVEEAQRNEDVRELNKM